MSQAFKHKPQFKGEKIKFDIQKLNWFRDLKFNLNEIKETSHNYMLIVCLLGSRLPRRVDGTKTPTILWFFMRKIQTYREEWRDYRHYPKVGKEAKPELIAVSPAELAWKGSLSVSILYMCWCNSISALISVRIFKFSVFAYSQKISYMYTVLLDQIYNPFPPLPRIPIITSFQPHVLFLLYSFICFLVY